MRWLRNAGMFILAIVLALAFTSTPASATDVNTISLTTSVVEFAVPDLPAADLNIEHTLIASSYAASVVSLSRLNEIGPGWPPSTLKSFPYRAVRWNCRE